MEGDRLGGVGRGEMTQDHHSVRNALSASVATYAFGDPHASLSQSGYKVLIGPEVS
jgi:hypothetical protein